VTSHIVLASSDFVQYIDIVSTYIGPSRDW
jgi:hypothetical protein